MLIEVKSLDGVITIMDMYPKGMGLILLLMHTL